jgi:hypothetical protein
MMVYMSTIFIFVFFIDWFAPCSRADQSGGLTQSGNSPFAGGELASRTERRRVRSEFLHFIFESVDRLVSVIHLDDMRRYAGPLVARAPGINSESFSPL